MYVYYFSMWRSRPKAHQQRALNTTVSSTELKSRLYTIIHKISRIRMYRTFETTPTKHTTNTPYGCIYIGFETERNGTAQIHNEILGRKENKDWHSAKERKESASERASERTVKRKKYFKRRAYVPRNEHYWRKHNNHAIKPGRISVRDNCE